MFKSAAKIPNLCHKLITYYFALIKKLIRFVNYKKNVNKNEKQD
jgi:hypothetical protein